MGVHLRTKENKKGRLSYYLDFWPAVKNPSTGKMTRREFLGIHPYEKADTPEKKQFNREARVMAEKIKVEREIEILKGEYKQSQNRKSKVNFIEFFQKIASSKRDSVSNYQNWASALNYLKAYAGTNYPVEKIDEAFCSGYRKFLLETDQLGHRGKKLKQNSASSFFNKFRHAIIVAVRQKFLTENPLENVPRIGQQNTKKDFLTKEELQQLWETECEVPMMKNMVFFMVYSGLRWSDASTLKWKDIQFSEDMGHYVHFMEKKGKKELLQNLSDQIMEILPPRGAPHELVFAGLEYSDRNNKKMQEWVESAGISKEIRYHVMRHTHASLTYQATGDIFMVQERLGHANVRTTAEVYTKKSGRKRKEAANAIHLNLKGENDES
jgi:integrase